MTPPQTPQTWTAAEMRKRRAHPPTVTLFTLCYWTAIGCAVGALLSIALLEWMR